MDSTAHVRDAAGDPAYADLVARLAPICALPDGTVLVEPVGAHFHVVTKEHTNLRFWLVDQTQPSTGVIQSEIDLADPLKLQEAYTEAMLLTLAWQPSPRRVYMTGLGGGRLALVLHHFCPAARIECAEIEPEIIRLAERFFGIRPDERLRIAIADGRGYLAQRRARYDLLLIDAFLDNGYSPYRMATVEFYRLCRKRLAPDGALAVNLLANDPFVERRLESIARVFPAVWLFSSRPVDGDENLVALATNQTEMDQETLIARACAVETRYGLPAPLGAYAATLTRQFASDRAALRDARPPGGYFDSLPRFDTPFSRVGSELPCPCGSGLAFGACHGRAERLAALRKE
jgi:spermidine synthase